MLLLGKYFILGNYLWKIVKLHILDKFFRVSELPNLDYFVTLKMVKLVKLYLCYFAWARKLYSVFSL